MTKQITAFYHQACTYLPSVNPPPTPSTKEVALVAITLFALYKIYKKFQSLENRVTQLEQEKITYQNDKNTTQENIEELKLKLTTAEGTIKTLSESIDNLKSRKNLAEKSTSLSDYESCEDNDEAINSPENHEDLDLGVKSSNDSNPSNENSKLEISSVQINSAPLTPLEQFKKQIPGNHLDCGLQSERITLDAYLLKKLFRVDEILDCKDGGQGHFTLTYKEAKVFKFTELPPFNPEKVPDFTERTKIQAIRLVVWGVMKAITVQFQLSTVVKVQIKKVDGATHVIFEPTSFSLMPNYWEYTAYLKFLTIYDQPEPEKNHHLSLEVEHNSTKTTEKGGPISHESFVDLLEFVEKQNSK